MADPRDLSTAVLATDRLSKSFGGLAAVRDVSIELKVHELHAVIGPNGAGKSTFVNLLTGQLRPSNGRIILGGRDVTGTPAWRMAHLGVARSFQRTNILRPLSVLENVRLAAQAVHLPTHALLAAPVRRQVLVEKALTALARVGLTDAAGATAGTLSHGAQRQLEIAMTLVIDPKVILLDEPLAGMGQEEGERMAALLQSLAREHAVLLIEHDMDFVFKVADRMTVLVEGAVLASGSPEQVRSDRAVQAAYLGAPA
ncbi:MAG: ABC transporter ATP-binding protein [Hyphomicrobiaceae bacterium]|nr:ABC transporter ATP-binding protein [Hyphomicrobiaceae bacterium]